MLACLGILVASLLIALYEVPLLLKKKMLTECFIFSFLLILGTFLSMSLALGVHLPNPLDWINKVMKPVSDWIDTILK